MMFELSPFGIALPEWVIATATLALWIGLIGVVFRFLFLRARERLRCPVRHRMAYPMLLRGPDGTLQDVARCSLIRRGKPFTCGKQCLRSAHA